MKNINLENVDCHATLAMIEKRWGFPRRTLRALLGMTENTQSGRSMIEMLGVLAIIGVLSVGGIAGYSKAMQKYRINKAIEQITLIAGNVRSFFAPQRSYNGVGCSGISCTDLCYGQDNEGAYDHNGCPIIKKARILPDEMITLDSTGKLIVSITNPFGYTVNLNQESKLMSGDMQAFNVMYFFGDNIEACIEMMTRDWTSADIKAINLKSSSSGDILFFKTPIAVDLATEKCSTAIAAVSETNKTKGYPRITFYFDIDLNSSYWKNMSWQN